MMIRDTTSCLLCVFSSLTKSSSRTRSTAWSKTSVESTSRRKLWKTNYLGHLLRSVYIDYYFTITEYLFLSTRKTWLINTEYAGCQGG